MFIKKWDTPVVEGTKALNLVCANCHNHADHHARTFFVGPSIGIVFMKTPLLSMRRYGLVCSICGNLARELTRAEVDALKE
jgi:hypothetical protein